MDCGVDTDKNEEYYMLKHMLLRSINPEVKGKLCLTCAEVRLGRGLVGADFLDVPVNAQQAAKCPPLALRLSRGS